MALAIALLTTAACSDSNLLPTPTPTPTTCPTPSTIVPDPFGPIPCATAAEIASVNADVSIAFESDPTGPSLACEAAEDSADLTPLRKSIYDAILYMRQVRFDTPLPWTNESLYAWFVRSQRGIRVRNANSSCCDPPGVISISANLRDSRMSSIPGPLAVLVHETRHAEGFPHTCRNVNDNTIDELGAWGVQYYLMVWLGTHTPAATLDERSYSINRAGFLRSSFCFECAK